MLADRVPIWEEELRQDGAARMLLLLLRHRFGELPDSVGTLIKICPRKQLEFWAVQLFYSRSINDLFW